AVWGLVALALAAGAVHAGGAREEQQRLQGEWEFVEFSSSAAKKPPANVFRGKTAVIEGDKLTLFAKTAWGIRLAPTRQPAEIDLVLVTGVNKDKVMRGIYKLEG